MTGGIIVKPGSIFDIDLITIFNKELKMAAKANLPVPFDKIDPNIYIDLYAKTYYAITIKANENGYKFQIGFSNLAFQEFKYDLDAYKNIAMHEIIHTCPKCFTHRKQWKHWVNYMNKNFGYKINPKPYGKDTFETIGLY